MRRRLFTTEQFYEGGGTRARLRWGERSGHWVRVVHGVYADGDEPPNAFELAVGRMLATNVDAWGTVAGVLHASTASRLANFPRGDGHRA